MENHFRAAIPKLRMRATYLKRVGVDVIPGVIGKHINRIRGFSDMGVCVTGGNTGIISALSFYGRGFLRESAEPGGWREGDDC